MVLSAPRQAEFVLQTGKCLRIHVNIHMRMHTHLPFLYLHVYAELGEDDGATAHFVNFDCIGEKVVVWGLRLH